MFVIETYVVVFVGEGGFTGARVVEVREEEEEEEIRGGGVGAMEGGGGVAEALSNCLLSLNISSSYLSNN